jgi:hypothetical protein
MIRGTQWTHGGISAWDDWKVTSPLIQYQYLPSILIAKKLYFADIMDLRVSYVSKNKQ